MPPGVGYGDDQMMQGIGAMLAGEQAPSGTGPAPVPPEAGGESDAVATLVMENLQLRELLGLGPDDPVPAAPGGAGAPAVPQGAPPAGPPSGGRPPF